MEREESRSNCLRAGPPLWSEIQCGGGPNSGRCPTLQALWVCTHEWGKIQQAAESQLVLVAHLREETETLPFLFVSKLQFFCYFWKPHVDLNACE
eukprot:3167084-Amphidinium_carterae.3